MHNLCIGTSNALKIVQNGAGLAEPM